MPAQGQEAWNDALGAAALFATDPHGCGGVALRALPGAARDTWLSLIGKLLPEEAPFCRVPLHVSDERLLGGLDLTATLNAGRPVAARGLLAAAEGGSLVLSMAERVQAQTAAHIAAALDRPAAQLSVIALDEGLEPDEAPPAALLDRLAFGIDLSGVSAGACRAPDGDEQQILEARTRCGAVKVDEAAYGVLCEAAWACGIASLRAPLLALAAARTSAALASRDAVAMEDLTRAARLVFGWRATRLPQPAQSEEASEESEPEQVPDDEQSEHAGEEAEVPLDDASAMEIVLEAVATALPVDLLKGASVPVARRSSATRSGRGGGERASARHGRPAGVRPGRPVPGARVSVIETLRAAAPWQRIRRAARPADDRHGRIVLRSEDVRVHRLRQRSVSTVLFAVDASGSTALGRLAEAKGAVELLLAQCYIRRDQVALLVFRGTGAEVLLPPTRSLLRAKRSLAAMPGGGGTPLAAGIQAAAAVLVAAQRRGDTPLLVLLTDGRPNVGADGSPGRAGAEADALQAASLIPAQGVQAVVVDTAQRAGKFNAELAQRMQATLLSLPNASAATLSDAVGGVLSEATRT